MAYPTRNLGLITDVALLMQQGSTLAAREHYWVLTTPTNPTFHWGNVIILRDAPNRGSLAGWLEAFRAEHPEASHVAIAIDERGMTVDPAEALALGLEVEHDVILTAESVTEQEQPPPVECRLFDVEDDQAWQRAVELDVTSQPGDVSDSYRTFTQRRLEGLRALQREGTGGWFGAFDGDGALLGNLGIYRTDANTARFQNVLTAVAHRRQGIAGALVRAAGAWALTHLGAQTIVIVADTTGPAIAVYRAAGLQDTHTQTSLYAPGLGSPPRGPEQQHSQTL